VVRPCGVLSRVARFAAPVRLLFEDEGEIGVGGNAPFFLCPMPAIIACEGSIVGM
jgi:hypothetical protein